MEDRYELRGTIGQGGIGSVHRAYDHKLKREVAIKRILTSHEDPSLEEEATKQLMVEAGALASLQHPHIVTILDVGRDEQGPYVVMELISGKTLDDIIEANSLTWEDFKEIATQSLEALIAAQELDMIHSDLKPPNIMLTWLPSGKFQVKIVDFGLAVLVQNQSQEEIEKMDTVFGSIFFMPPEQFERKTLDARSDLYSLGCCFYQALAGKYPFNGETGAEVMEAHLNHSVRPLEEIRPDLPTWACQWVMWLINRDRDHRPESAREALAVFVKNESQPQMKRPRLVTAGMVPATAVIAPGTTAVQTPSLTAAQRTAVTHDAAAVHAAPAARRSLAEWRPSKIQIKLAAAAVVLLVLTMTVLMIKNRNERIRRDNAYNNIVSAAKADGVKAINIGQTELWIILDFIREAKANANLADAYNALLIAESGDGTDLDAAIVHFATTTELPAEIRRQLFGEVIRKRDNHRVVPDMLRFAATTNDSDLALAAVNAVTNLADDRYVEDLVNIIATTSNPKLRESTESLVKEVIHYSDDRASLAQLITKSNRTDGTTAARQSLNRLLDLCKPEAKAPVQQAQQPRQTQQPRQSQVARPPKPSSTAKPPWAEPSKELQSITEGLKANDETRQIEALRQLATSTEDATHAILMNFCDGTLSDKVRLEVMKAFIQHNSQPQIFGKNDPQGRWRQMIWRCKNSEDYKVVIDSLKSFRAAWAIAVLEELKSNRNSSVSSLAKEALAELSAN